VDRDEAHLVRARQLRRRKLLRTCSLLLLISVGALLAFRAIRPSNDDYKLFDARSFAVSRALDGDSFVLADDRDTQVTLLGVDAPEPGTHFADQAASYLAGRLRNARVLLRLDGTQTRDERNRLRAYVYLLDTDLLNADIIRDGRAYADRRIWHPFAPSLAQQETDARKNDRGLWQDLTDEQMPPWRREWLRSLNRPRP
jgi:endonuclease YncB( thermonuclease family)